MKRQQQEEEFLPKELEVFYYDMNRTSVTVEKPKYLGLITAQSLADLDYIMQKVNEILMTWPQKLQDLNKYQIKELQVIKQNEFDSFRNAVRWWTLNIHHPKLFPTLSEVLRSGIIPSEEIISQQNFWTRLIDPQKIDKLILENEEKSIEIIEHLQKLKEKEESYELRNI